MFDVIAFYLAVALLAFTCIKNKAVSAVISLGGFVLALADFFCLQIMGQHLDYTTIARVDGTMLAMAPQVTPAYFYGGVTALFAITALHWLAYRRLSQHAASPVTAGQPASVDKPVLAACVAVAVGLLACSDTAAAYKNMLLSAKQLQQSFSLNKEQLWHKLQAQGTYLTPQHITAKAGKNIVVIYCESLEQGFLDRQSFPYEAPRLQGLIDEGWYSYSNYQCLDGADWTVGALYATQTGLPAYLGANSDTLFGSIRQSEATSYAGVLARAGYNNLLRSNGDLSFAGTGNIMERFGYVVKGHDECPGGVKTIWGVHDYDLFRMAKQEYAALAQGDRPFNMTLLTVDTHFPKGVPDPRLRPYVDSRVREDTHEFALASLDYLLGDFLDFIKTQPRAEDTVVVILGDHLLMGDFRHTQIIKKFGNVPRRIALLTNKRLAGFGEADHIAYYDMPAILLQLAEVEHNAKFPKDVLPVMDEQFVAQHKELLTSLNLKLNGM